MPVVQVQARPRSLVQSDDELRTLASRLTDEDFDWNTPRSAPTKPSRFLQTQTPRT